MSRPTPIKPGPGQESVWDYPRPPRLEAAERHIQVIFNDVVIADTRRAQRVLETSHPPTYYIPPEDVRMEYLVVTRGTSVCEWKGVARYYSVRVGEREAEAAAWAYPAPTSAFAAIRNHLAFYAQKVDRCLVDGKAAHPQPGGFYGGWVTDDVVGPFKGEPGTMWW